MIYDKLSITCDQSQFILNLWTITCYLWQAIIYQRSIIGDPKLKKVIHKSYVMTIILNANEARCLRENTMAILSTEKSMERAMCGVQLNERKIRNLPSNLDMNETINQLAMANSECWYYNVIWWEDGYVLRKAFHVEAEGQREKEARKGNGRRRLRKRSRTSFDHRRCSSLRTVDVNHISTRLRWTRPPSCWESVRSKTLGFLWGT